MAKNPEEESSLDTILELKHREPFVPFWIMMNSGDRYLIEDPDALTVGNQQLHYYLPKSDRAVHLRSNQISAVEETEHRPAA